MSPRVEEKRKPLHMIEKRQRPELQTPMMRQYLAIKEKHPREILFFRMGDFYEMFLDDAEEASQLLGLTLTSRSKDKGAIPMAGIPVRALDSYLPKLLEAGKRVAICEQTEDPKEAKGIVDREVVRVISPGTITDERLVDEKSNNFIAAIAQGKKDYGLAWLDVTTGQFLIWEADEAEAILAQLARIDPAEILLPESLAFQPKETNRLTTALDGIVQSPYPDPLFDPQTAYRCLTEQFGTRTLEGFGCDHMKHAIAAGGGLMRYVLDTQKNALRHITKITPFRHQKHVPIDQTTRRALEISETYRGGNRSGTLISCFDRTSTALGARLLREWLMSPLTDVDTILQRQNSVADLVKDEAVRCELIELLRQVHDLERLSTRLSYRSANARDLVALARTLEIIPSIDQLLARCDASYLQDLRRRFDVPHNLVTEIGTVIVDDPPISIKEGGIIREGFEPELDEVREIASQGTRWIASFQHREIERTGIPSLKIGYNKVFGYYLEVTNTHLGKVPEHYIRKQTLKNCERFLTADLKEYETKVLNAKERAVSLEYDLFCNLRDQATSHIQQLQKIAGALAEVDVLSTFARLAHERRYTRPVVNESRVLRIVDGRHPIVEEFQGGETFVPNPIDLTPDGNIMVITGPNMAGKSTYIRQIALLTLLAQTGSFLPAREAEIGVVDRIFTRVGAADDLARGQSTFMVEMNETANILNNATDRSLIILDEVGRGTSTFDGVSLAWAITEFLAEKVNCRTLFATHYHELTALSTLYPSLRNFNFSVKEWKDEIIFLRQLVEGGTDKSYGIHVARLAGIPAAVLDRAKEILANLESQAFDLQDQPKLAHKNEPSAPSAPDGSRLQLDFFRSANEKILEELKAADLNSMTPLEALQLFADLQKRLV